MYLVFRFVPPRRESVLQLDCCRAHGRNSHRNDSIVSTFPHWMVDPIFQIVWFLRPTEGVHHVFGAPLLRHRDSALTDFIAATCVPGCVRCHVPEGRESGNLRGTSGEPYIRLPKLNVEGSSPFARSNKLQAPSIAHPGGKTSVLQRYWISKQPLFTGIGLRADDPEQ